MTDSERELLIALARVCEQYMGSDPPGALDHLFMSAGERAVEVLAKHGLVEPDGRGGNWTDTGHALLAEAQRNGRTT